MGFAARQGRYVSKWASKTKKNLLSAFSIVGWFPTGWVASEAAHWPGSGARNELSSHKATGTSRSQRSQGSECTHCRRLRCQGPV